MKKIAVVFVLLMLVIAAGPANAQQLMKLEETQQLINSKAMKEVKAKFQTVVRGTDIKSFNIIMRDVYTEPGFKVIMFVSNRKIAAGMSGSPVYVDGKLVGAVSYTFNSHAGSDWWWGGITPIDLMIEQAEAGSRHISGLRTFKYRGMVFEPISVGYHEIQGLESSSAGKVMLMSGGASSASSKLGKVELKAGMPIVVDLMEWADEKGEVSTMSAMGTITYIDGKGRIYAFGHPFLDSRRVVYSFRTAEVIDTIRSQEYSYKLAGRKSEVLGVITYDASYGISGSVSLNKLDQLHHFGLEFKTEGKPLHKFDIKVAHSVVTPLLVQSAFNTIGTIYGAPFPEETSVTELGSEVKLDGHQSIVWNELFSSSSFRFGAATIFESSYANAYKSFFNSVYGVIYNNKYGLKISDVLISVNFIPGRSQTFKLDRRKFPNKVVWGQNPVFQVSFVSQDNSIVIKKRAEVIIDWDKVERPVYTKSTLDTEKDSEKVVKGGLSIESAAAFFMSLKFTGGIEKQKLMPEYFLGPEDFLENLSRQLEATNQKVYVRVSLESRSGLFDDIVANAEDIVPVSEGNEAGWNVIQGGLTERKLSIQDEGVVTFYVDLPQVPSGYVVDQNLQEKMYFEVVLDE